MHLAPAGDRALLVELGEVTASRLHAANRRAQALSGVVRSIPGHSSLYVIFDGEPDATALLRALEEAREEEPHAPSVTRLIAVAFDGDDLPEFLSQLSLTREAFLARVDGLPLVARYLGFRAGFAYLDGWPEEWAMPRRSTSRPVRKGSFAIAGDVAAFYPLDTPGGWSLLGRTDADLEDAISVGEELRLRVVDPDRLGAVPPRVRAARNDPRVELVNAPLATFTDRPFDELAAAIANRAVGNEVATPLFECPLAGPRLRLRRDAVLAWCTPSLEVKLARVRAGEERSFGRVSGGLRGYLAVGEREGSVDEVTRGDRTVIRAKSGPHDIGLREVECEVTPQLDRVGIRLRPVRPLEQSAPAGLRSIGMQCGTVQLHPDGSLVAMGPDHPVTGGYLQPMTVLWDERWKLAQLMPGERVMFVCD